MTLKWFSMTEHERWLWSMGPVFNRAALHMMRIPMFSSCLWAELIKPNAWSANLGDTQV